MEYGMYLKCLQKPRCLGWFKTSQVLRSAVWKTRLNSSKDNFIAKSFRLSTKRKLSILLNFLFPFVSFICVFSILKCKTLVLKTITWWTRGNHFVDGWHLLKCQIRFFPHPLKWLTWPLDVCGGLGYGWFYWFSLRIFSPTTSLELEIFSSRYNGVSFFQHYTSWATFFNAGCFFPRNIFACFFPPEISLQDIFFLESPITPQKSNSRPLKSTKHLVSWQILICQSFLKAFETIGD